MKFIKTNNKLIYLIFNSLHYKDYFEVNKDTIILHKKKQQILKININEIQTIMKVYRIQSNCGIFLNSKSKTSYQIKTNNNNYEILFNYINSKGKNIVDYLVQNKGIKYKEVAIL